MIKGIDDKAFFLIVDIYESSVKKNCKNMKSIEIIGFLYVII